MNTPQGNRTINFSQDGLDHSEKRYSTPDALSRLFSTEDSNSVLSELSNSKVKFRRQSLSTIETSKGKAYYNHWTVNYCTGAEDIEGVLFFTNDALNFIGTKVVETSKAVLSSWLGFSRKSESYNKKFGFFHISISVHDIADCNIMTFLVPSIDQEQHTDKSHIIQFNLLDHGDFKLDEKLDQTVTEMRSNNKPYACVYFNIKADDCIGELEKSDDLVLQIQSKFQQTKQIYKTKARLLESNIIPYFELLTDHIKVEDTSLFKTAKKQIRESCDKAIDTFKEDKKGSPDKDKSGNAQLNLKARRVSSRGNKKVIITPIVQGQSDIVDIDKFAQIISCVPDIYHLFEWKLLYSSNQHGTSYNSLLRRAKHAKPFLVIIKDAFGNIFGAYGSEDLRYTQQYYGSGETFIFSFKKSNEIKPYFWSKKNDMFIHANEQGFMFGTGPFYGLWIDCELSRGRTHMCDTFSNQLLSDSTDFNIAKIEVWGVVDPFSKK